MIMPYGKHKGEEICSLPSGYLKWIAENWNERTERDRKICEMADKEWTERERYGTHIE